MEDLLAKLRRLKELERGPATPVADHPSDNHHHPDRHQRVPSEGDQPYDHSRELSGGRGGLVPAGHGPAGAVPGDAPASGPVSPAAGLQDVGHPAPVDGEHRAGAIGPDGRGDGGVHGDREGSSEDLDASVSEAGAGDGDAWDDFFVDPLPGEPRDVYLLRLREAARRLHAQPAVRRGGHSGQGDPAEGVLPDVHVSAGVEEGVGVARGAGQAVRRQASRVVLVPGWSEGRLPPEVELRDTGLVGEAEGEPEPFVPPLAAAEGATYGDIEVNVGKLANTTTTFLPSPNEQGFRLVQDYTYVEIERREEVTPIDPVGLAEGEAGAASHSPELSRTVTPIESIFARMGAKSQLRTWLVQQFPDTHTYVEPFTGSAKVLLWKPRRARVEIINDFDADLASFLRYVQSDPHRLVQVINALPTHEAVVLGMRTMLAKRELKGVERAAGFYITSQSAFNTKGDYSSYKSSPHVLMDLSIDLSKVLKVHDRLNTGKKVDIRSTGYERIIKACNKDLPSSRYPPGGVFFYLDPPYWATAGYKTLQGESSFGWRDQVNLANLCYEIHLMGNKFMQTNSYHEDLLKLYGGFKDSMGRPMFYLQDVNVRYTVAGSREEGELDKELVISNYPINSAQRQMGLL